MSHHPDHISDLVDRHSRPTKTGRSAFTLAELLIVIAVIAVLVALLLPLSRSSGPASRRFGCVNNLKQIALGIHNYESKYNALPPAYTVDATGKPLHSWRTLILPHVGEERLYETIDLSKPWNDPANANAYAKTPSLYRCPELSSPANVTAYLAIVAPGGCFLPDESRCLSEITDGTSLTLMLIEAPADQAVHWMAPLDASESLVMGISPGSRLNHAGGMNAAYADGSVRFLRARDPAAERRAMISISGNDDQADRAMN
jgi:prepilin-type N-terminal cleavage/methylation domain-containing protein/prepilin-type processing-associated H-X9-DG protein